MEPITQALLGAAVGQAGFARTLGRRALGWGALIGMLPDLDVLAAPLHGGYGEMLYHRGSTHALWFGPVVGSLMGWALWKWRDGTPEHLRPWIGLCVLVLVTHPLLDVFTPYGTQLLAPFSRVRFAWNGVGIIDPLYTVILALGLLAGAVAPERARATGAIALALSCTYLGYGVWLNSDAKAQVERALAEEGVDDARVRVYPTVFQPWLRRFVARSADELHVGLYTAWRQGDPWWESAPASTPDPRVDDLLATWEGGVFQWFAMDEIAWRVRRVGPGSVVEVDDLRYGFPGEAPDHGFWGIRARYTPSGERSSAVERYAQRRSGRMRSILRAVWRATWGDLESFASEGNRAPSLDARR